MRKTTLDKTLHRHNFSRTVEQPSVVLINYHVAHCIGLIAFGENEAESGSYAVVFRGPENWKYISFADDATGYRKARSRYRRLLQARKDGSITFDDGAIALRA